MLSVYIHKNSENRNLIRLLLFKTQMEVSVLDEQPCINVYIKSSTRICMILYTIKYTHITRIRWYRNISIRTVQQMQKDVAMSSKLEQIED